jgi:hypothetical protein
MQAADPSDLQVAVSPLHTILVWILMHAACGHSRLGIAGLPHGKCKFITTSRDSFFVLPRGQIRSQHTVSEKATVDPCFTARPRNSEHEGSEKTHIEGQDCVA